MAALPPKPRPDYFAKGLSILWIIFIIWSVVGAVIIPFGVSAYNLEDFVSNRDLLALGKVILPLADATWMTLAGVCTYFLLVQAEGLDRARRISVVVVLGSAVVEYIGVRTGFPFGPYLYPDSASLVLNQENQWRFPVLGMKLLGVLPYTIPLAWLVIVAGGRHLLLWAFPGWTWNRWGHAAVIALLAMLTDLNLEQVAWKVREYWIWYPHRREFPLPEWPPLQNFIAWYVVAFLLAATFPAPRGGFAHPTAPWRLALMLVVINVIFLLTHIAGWLGWRH